MSALKDRILADFKAAMLARDTFRSELLGGLKAAILNEEVAKGIRDTGLVDEAIEQVIAREVRKREESARMFSDGGRSESAEKERQEAAILKNYLPVQLSETEIQKLVDTAITDVQPDGMKDMGRVIGAVKAAAGNTADGATIARLVKTSLQ